MNGAGPSGLPGVSELSSERKPKTETPLGRMSLAGGLMTRASV